MRPLFATAGVALLCLVAAATADSDRVRVYPALAAAPLLDDVRDGSGLKVLLPEVMHADDLTTGRRRFRLRANVRDGSYSFYLVNRACSKTEPCRRIVAFSGRETSAEPGGDIELERGRMGAYVLGYCTGTMCIPPSVAWVERGTRYRVYGYVSKRKLASYADQAIRNGPRRKG
jgi:hypothetical protein